MNKYEQTGAQELLSMLNDEELMSVKDTVTKALMPTNSVRERNFIYISFILKFSVRKRLMRA
jgi:hypothetical protein